MTVLIDERHFNLYLWIQLIYNEVNLTQNDLKCF